MQNGMPKRFSFIFKFFLNFLFLISHSSRIVTCFWDFVCLSVERPSTKVMGFFFFFFFYFLFWLDSKSQFVNCWGEGGQK